MDHFERNAVQRAKAALDLLTNSESPVRPLGFIGLSAKEIREYSVLSPLGVVGSRPDAKREGLEFEASDTVAKQIGREPTHRGAFFVPPEILTRTMTSVGVSGSNYLV